jgi:hypothetical protein
MKTAYQDDGYADFYSTTTSTHSKPGQRGQRDRPLLGSEARRDVGLDTSRFWV